MNNDILKNHPAYKMARDAYGFQFEVDMLQEECAELILAASKVKRVESNDEHEVAKAMTNFFAEMGDVENLIQQMKFWFAESECEKLVEQFRIEKLDRLVERINNGTN